MIYYYTEYIVYTLYPLSTDSLYVLDGLDLLVQGAHDVIITSLLRQNDVATPFRRHNDVIIASSVRWVVTTGTAAGTVLTTVFEDLSRTW